MNISKKEVLRYLGYGNQRINYNLDCLINECINETIENSAPKNIYAYFDLEDLKILGTNYAFQGNDIKLHLQDCDGCIILAATLGVKIDSLIRKYEIANITKALILDACASVLIESYKNETVETISIENKYLTSDFSPGYGDFPISFQETISKILLSDKKIGLTVTENFIMIPKKSITSVIGVSDKKVTGKLSGCKNCALFQKCAYRKRGIICGN